MNFLDFIINLVNGNEINGDLEKLVNIELKKDEERLKRTISYWSDDEIRNFLARLVINDEIIQNYKKHIKKNAKEMPNFFEEEIEKAKKLGFVEFYREELIGKNPNQYSSINALEVFMYNFDKDVFYRLQSRTKGRGIEEYSDVNQKAILYGNYVVNAPVYSDKYNKLKSKCPKYADLQSAVENYIFNHNELINITNFSVGYESQNILSKEEFALEKISKFPESIQKVLGFSNIDGNLERITTSSEEINKENKNFEYQSFNSMVRNISKSVSVIPEKKVELVKDIANIKEKSTEEKVLHDESSNEGINYLRIDNEVLEKETTADLPKKKTLIEGFKKVSR